MILCVFWCGYARSGQYAFPSPLFDRVSEGAKDFIRKLLVVDHRFRLSAKAAQVAAEIRVERRQGHCWESPWRRAEASTRTPWEAHAPGDALG